MTKQHGFFFGGETLKSASGANEDEPLRSIRRRPGLQIGVNRGRSARYGRRSEEL